MRDPNATVQAVDKLEGEVSNVVEYVVPNYVKDLQTQIVEAHRAYRQKMVRITQDARSKIET